MKLLNKRNSEKSDIRLVQLLDNQKNVLDRGRASLSVKILSQRIYRNKRLSIQRRLSPRCEPARETVLANNRDDNEKTVLGYPARRDAIPEPIVGQIDRAL